MRRSLNPTPEHADEVERAFARMISAVPRSRRGDHAFAINEVSLVLALLRQRAERKERMKVAPFSPRVSRRA